MKPTTIRSRGFTLLETVLAAVLGALVILVAFSLFTVVQRSDKRSQVKMEENLELASAHTMISRAFHYLLMSSEPRPSESETNEFLKGDDERNSADLADQEDDGAASKRFYLQPDANNPFVMTIGTDDQPRRARSQVFGLTVRFSPIPGEGDKTPEQALEEQIIHERVMLRAYERLSARTGSGSSSRRTENSNAAMSESDVVDRATGGSDPRDRRLSLRDRSGRSGAGSSDRATSGIGSDDSALGDENSDGPDDRTASERLDDAEAERPRAPGVRGVFEILPDGVDAGGEFTGAGVSMVRLEEGDGSPTYSLWWRELPPIEINDDTATSTDTGENGTSDGKDDSTRAREADSAGAAIDREVQRLSDASDASGKRVRLLSGLKTCHWTAFRGRKERDKLTAKWDSHLPAFVELELVTASGRRENWIFDVAWSVGPEPGSLVAQAPDALNAGVGGVGGVDGDPNGQTGDPTGDGKGNPTGDGKGGQDSGKGNTGKGGKGNKGGNKNEPTQQDINKIIDDAIKRATQQGGK